MQNEMRDRLIELIDIEYDGEPNCLLCEEASDKCQKCEHRWEYKLADRLIENGVIVPPCKVGDIVWVDDFMWGLIPCKVDRPYHCICGENGSCTFEMSFTDDDIGKTVFLTKEEAEQKLRREDKGK
jgi:hypothetical protein